MIHAIKKFCPVLKENFNLLTPNYNQNGKVEGDLHIHSIMRKVFLHENFHKEISEASPLDDGQY